MLDVPVHVVWQIISDAVSIGVIPNVYFLLCLQVPSCGGMIFCLKNGGVTRLWLVLAIYWNWRKAKREHRGMPLWSSLSIKRILLQSTLYLFFNSVHNDKVYRRFCLLEFLVSLVK